IIYFLLSAVYNLFFHPLSKYPGPWWYAVSRLPYTIEIFRGTVTWTTKEMHMKYGHVVRIAPDTLSFTTSQAWQDIYGFRQASTGRGNIPKDPITYLSAGDAASAKEDDHHRRLRRIQSHAFSDKALVLQEAYLHQYTSLFIKKLREEVEKVTGTDSGAAVLNFSKWVNFLTTDIIGDLSFGESFGGLEQGEMHPWLDTVFWTLKAFTYLRELYRYPLLPMGAILACIPKEMVKHRAEALSFGATAASRRMAMETDRPDFMSYILKNSQGEKGMSRLEIEASAITFIIAGSETTATMMAGTMYMLCKSPATLRRLTETIRSEFASPSELTLVKLQHQEYLNAVINEGLRLYPPAPDGLFRRTKAQGATVAGHFIPPNTSVGINLLAAHRHPLNFHRPDEMVPERWLKPCPPEFEKDDRNVVKPFSVGPRDCLGKNLAWAEMRMILAYLVWHFDFEMVPETEGWIERQTVFMLWKKSDLLVKVSLREF
ncbi:isotrichodermin C-15 hydroxylase, partial [Sodiomyces alkalinus F11]